MKLNHKHYLTLVLIKSGVVISSKCSVSFSHGYNKGRFGSDIISEHIKRR